MRLVFLLAAGGLYAQTFDEALNAYLAKNGVAAAPVDDRVFVRRAYLDFWGFVPSPEQQREFAGDKSPDKRARLVRQLLAHRENFSEHWLTWWNDLLRNEDRFGTYGGDRKTISPWLKQALESNLPFDRMLLKLLDPREKDDPDGFLAGVNWRGEANSSQMPWIQAAQNTAQVFVGINLKCNSCHDSFISKWKLKDAYSLAAFFSPEPKIEIERCDAKTGQFATAHYLFPDLDRPTGDSLAERRAAAAAIFTDPRNTRVARTMAHRVWARLLGRGFVEPIDEMDRKPWSPEILDRLAADFAAHNYDFDWLISTIATSRAYQLPSVDKPDAVFRGPLVRRMTAEQFADSLAAVTGEWPVYTPPNAREARYVREARLSSTPLTRALGRPFRDQVVTERSTEATMLQGLELVNGPDLYARLYRGAQGMTGAKPPAPRNLFDSLVMRGNTEAVSFDIDVRGLERVYLVVADSGSYSPSDIRTVWTVEGAETLRPRVGEVRPLPLRGVSRFRGMVQVDPDSNRSDFSPAIRFFVFAENPNLDRLVPVSPQRPVTAEERVLPREQLAQRIFLHALGREASPAERALIGKGSVEETADLLWAIVATPEFQLIR